MEKKKVKQWINPYINLLNSEIEDVLNLRDFPLSEYHGELLADRMVSATDIYVEIGSGSGKHLIEQATRKPEDLFIGFELRYKRAFRTVEKAKKRGLKNLLVVVGDAKLFMVKLFPASSLAGIYVYFPDPWEKKKWNKHRMINEDFLNISHRLLGSSGFIDYKTDHQEYFYSVIQQFVSSKLFEVRLKDEGSQLLQNEDLALASEFEMLFRSKKSPIYSLVARNVYK